MTSTLLPSTCSNKFEASDPFSYNRDSQRRDELIRLSARVSDFDTDISCFEAAPLHLIAQLLEERFIDPSDRQNLSPTALGFLEFMCRHPYALASGYAVSLDREDYRVTLESLTIPARYVTPQVQDEFEAFCLDADEIGLHPGLYCWWD